MRDMGSACAFGRFGVARCKRFDQGGVPGVGGRAVGIGMVSFLWLFAAAGQPPDMRQIAVIDLLGLPFLAVAAWQAFRPTLQP